VAPQEMVHGFFASLRATKETTWNDKNWRFDKLHQAYKADVAQLVEQPIRNRQVSGSSPLVGSIYLHRFQIPSVI
jgi:hypothetical protein